MNIAVVDNIPQVKLVIKEELRIWNSQRLSTKTVLECMPGPMMMAPDFIIALQNKPNSQ